MSPSPRRLALALLAVLALIVAAAPAVAQTTSELFLQGIFRPVRLVSPPRDDRIFVVQQDGMIRLFTNEGAPLGDFLNLTDFTNASGERGLLGLAFPLDYAETGHFFVNYTDLSGGDTQVVRYTVDAEDPNRADPTSASPVLTQDQPFSNHNGGHLEFGPDGMLYIGFGDGGDVADPLNTGQRGNTWLGKMLRIDVSGDSGYTIPDNPFVDDDPLDEIWAFGVRNPWCFSFDRQTGDLYIADVGQGELEEVDIQPAASRGGENYGWRLMEGTDCFNPPVDCNDGSLTLPVHEYTHGGNPHRCSISGGYVYRGNDIPEIVGEYFFADYCSNQIWSLRWNLLGGLGGVTERTSQLTPPGGFNAISAFGQDGQGELYILDLYGGRIYRIVADTTDAGSLPTVPRLEQNVPNPFNPQTTIAFTVPTGGASVRLEILDASGRRVRTLVDGPRAEGRQTVVWDGTDAAGRAMPAGTYLYRLSGPGVDEKRKMALLK